MTKKGKSASRDLKHDIKEGREYLLDSVLSPSGSETSPNPLGPNQVFNANGEIQNHPNVKSPQEDDIPSIQLAKGSQRATKPAKKNEDTPGQIDLGADENLEEPENAKDNADGGGHDNDTGKEK